MRIVIAGLSELGKLRQHALGTDCVGSVDAHDPLATYASIQEVSVDSYDAIFVCAGDKFSSARYGLVNGKHVLVERPFVTDELADLDRLAAINRVCLYVANPYRFDDNFLQVKQLISSRSLGKIYSCMVCYTNCASQNLISELGSSVLDIVYFWLGDTLLESNLNILRKKSLMNCFPDHVILGDLVSELAIQVELSGLGIENKVQCSLLAQYGSIEMQVDNDNNSTLSIQYDHHRKTSISKLNIVLEHEYFERQCVSQQPYDLRVEQWISRELSRMQREELLIA